MFQLKKEKEKLAQKDYDEKVIRNIKKEITAIEKYSSNYPIISVEHIYENLHIERQKLVRPIRESDEQHVQNWENVKYHGKEFDEQILLDVYS